MKTLNDLRVCRISPIGKEKVYGGRYSATRLLYMKTNSEKVVKHLVAYLTVQKWLVGDVP